MRSFLSLTLLALAFSTSAFASDTAGHTVTVEVLPVNEVAIVGGNVDLDIDFTYAAADSTAANLTWSTNESSKKITVQTSLGTIVYPLTVEAIGATGGTAAAAVVLTTTPADFVTGISLTDGGADLSYSATATAADGVGTESHTVTYTIVAG